jgi:hypothetical protein
MPSLNAAPVVLQPDVWMGPATMVLKDLADVGSALRERSTTAWSKGWTEKPFDFPNTYVNLPIRVQEIDPVSTYANDQNDRFTQRYLTKK